MVAALTPDPPVTDRRARLLLVNPSPIRGGAEELLIAFCARATRVSPVVACLADGPFAADLVAAGVEVEPIPAGRLRYPWAWARAVSALVPVARRADIVLSWQVKGHYYGTPAARVARAPAAWWDHGIRPARGEPRFLVDNVLPRSLRADLVVCSSAAAAARHRRSSVIHPGIPLESYARVQPQEARALLGIAPDEQAIGIVGRLQPWKGQHELLRAAPSVLRRFPRARFLVIGGALGGFSASYPDELERLARDLGIADRVSFLGHRDDVPSLLPGLDVFVHASRGEPFGLVVVEAMAAGVPVVASGSGGVPEIVEDGRSGLLTSGRANDIATAVCRFLEDPAFAARIASGALHRARERFSIERFVRDVEDLVLSLAEGKRP